MRLTPSQHEHLHELSTALARPTADTDALVKLGLAERGAGKFGEWARITAKGRDEDSRTTRDRGARAASTVSTRSAKTGQQFMPAPAAPLPSVTCASPPGRTSQELAPNTTAAAESRSDAPPVKECAAVVPNAVRVIHGNKVTYYDVASFEIIHDETKRLCRTGNHLYRSCPLAASAKDVLVLQ